MKSMQEYLMKPDSADGRIVMYLFNYDSDYTGLTASEIASNCYVANSYVTKFIQKVGFNNFADFKQELIRETYQNSYLKAGYDNFTINQYANNILISFMNTANKINMEEVEKLVEKINEVKKIVIAGIGGSAVICQDLYLKLYKLGYNVVFETDIHLQQTSANLADNQTLYIAISYSGPTGELLRNMNIAQDNGAYIVMFTANEEAGAKADQIFLTSALESANRNFSIISRTSLLMLTDIVYLTLIKTTV